MKKDSEYKFRIHERAEARAPSAKLLISLLLQETLEIVPEHRRELLNIALWKLTEAEGTHKHRTRFCSEAALSSPKENLRHDHVFQRAPMVRSLMVSSPDQIDTILARAVACTITQEEHILLNDHRALDGWERYNAAGIKVIDMSQSLERQQGANADTAVLAPHHINPMRKTKTPPGEPDPRDTVRIICLLVKRGLLDDATFRRMHHFGDSLSSFQKYCTKIKSFQPNSLNRQLHEELQRMLKSND